MSKKIDPRQGEWVGSMQEIHEFDPGQEEWAGWTQEWYGTVHVWSSGDYSVSVYCGRHNATIIDTTGDEGDFIYDAAYLPHATVVSILLANGYKPETDNRNQSKEKP